MRMVRLLAVDLEDLAVRLMAGQMVCLSRLRLERRPRQPGIIAIQEGRLLYDILQ
jgi:hypothetical protein